MCKKVVSIVIPVFNQEDSLLEVISRLKKVVSKLRELYNLEVIFIDDGSDDESTDILNKIYYENDFVKVIKLDRNIGQHYAIFAGIDYSQGEIVVVTDSDLDYSYSLIPKFIDSIESGYNYAIGYRVGYFSGFRKILNTFVSFLLLLPYRDITCPYRSLDRKMIEKVKRQETIEKFFFSLNKFSGKEIKIYPNFDYSNSHYTFLKKFHLFINIILNLLGFKKQSMVLDKIEEILK